MIFGRVASIFIILKLELVDAGFAMRNQTSAEVWFSIASLVNAQLD